MIKVKVHAKVNISLLITGKTDYHSLSSVLLSTALFDTVSIEKSDKFTVDVGENREGVAQKISSLFLRMKNDYGIGNVCVRSTCNIPLGGGLGGSSAVLAGVIVGLDKLFSLSLSKLEKIKLADSVGSDVAFMLDGGCGKIVDRSTVTDRFTLSPFSATIAVKGFSNTADVFMKYDENNGKQATCQNGKIIELLSCGKIKEAVSLSRNDLLESAVALCPSIGDALAILGDGSFMSGSGSAVVSVCASDEQISALKERGYTVINTAVGDYKTEIE